MGKALRPDPWLSDVLGRGAFQLRLTKPPLSSVDIESAVAELRASGGFCSAKVPGADVATVWTLERVGFRVVTTAVTFEKSIEPDPVDERWTERIRHATPSDRDDVVRIARENFEFSRFHADPLIAKEVADATRAAWVDSFFLGKRGDALVVGTENDCPTGFNLLIKPPSGVLSIDLIAVDRSHRGKGVAHDLILGGQAVCGKGYSQYRVVTQASNVASVRLYEKLGFRLVSSTYVLHFHGTG